ncbi:hypothetical protein ABIB73_000109 [Bradyrhizobium sp. F1.4.3]|uniref:hypothetical protein n=1 Tax=Bradyrhizobium sp. F1.4.3 TaxID=3156356 RepID=UPI00339158FE
MATKRKYAPPKYRDGGRVPLSADSVLTESEQQPMAVSADAPPQPSAADDPMMRAVELQRQAEALQHRRVQEPLTVEQYVDSLPNLNEHKRTFLRSNPEMLNGEQRELMSQAYIEAMQAGMRDDTPELDRWLVETVRSEMNSRRTRLADAARAATTVQPQRPELTVEREVERLDAEVAAHRAMDHANASTPATLAGQLPPTEPTPRAPRMPMTAPVSRDVPTASGRRRASPSQITLSPEERLIARNSFSAPGMTDDERERLYATNKARLQRERAEGRYPERERN